VLEEMSKACPEVRWYVMLVSEVRGDLRASYGKGIPTLTSTANQELLL
jgi:hypothetical protein